MEYGAPNCSPEFFAAFLESNEPCEVGTCEKRLPCAVCGCWTPCSPWALRRHEPFRVEEKPGMLNIPKQLPPCESFFIFIKEALRDRLPRCMRNYRRHFDVKQIRQRHLKAAEKREELLVQRKQRLTQRLLQVQLKTVALFVQQNLSWCRAKRLHESDMKAHVRRRLAHLTQRTAALRAHHEIVQSRSRLLRYGNYLRQIVESQQETQKRKGIF